MGISNIKVLHIINNLGSGGAEKLVRDLVPLINKLKYIKAEVLLLTDKNNVFYDPLINEGIKIKVIKYMNVYDPRNVLEIKNYISEGNYDIVHAHLFPTQYWVALAKIISRDKDMKFITTEHSTHNGRRGRIHFRLLDRLIYSQYDTIISVTQKTQDNLLNWIRPRNSHMKKYIVIRNGININKIKKAHPYMKRNLIEGIGEDTKLICMVGRFSEAKDQPTLIQAISRLSDDIHLILAGEGPLMNNNIELAKNLGISDRVHFLGFRSDIYRILKTVDVVVLSSKWEGFGLAAVEGMAAGKPLIASNIEGLREVVENTALLFNSGDSAELAISINKIFVKKTYNKYKNASNENVSIYSIQNMCMKYANLYKKIYLDTKGGGN